MLIASVFCPRIIQLYRVWLSTCFSKRQDNGIVEVVDSRKSRRQMPEGVLNGDFRDMVEDEVKVEVQVHQNLDVRSV